MAKSKIKNEKDPFAEREAQKYENPIPSREYILQFLSERGRPATYQQVQEELGIETSDEQEALRRRLIAMVRDGQLLKNRKGAYGPLEDMELIAGRVIGHKDGFGFVEPDLGGDDLFLSPREMRNVFHGDRVLTRVSSVDTRGRREATVVEVLEHNTQQLVGRLHARVGNSLCGAHQSTYHSGNSHSARWHERRQRWPDGGCRHYRASDETYACIRNGCGSAG